MQSGNEEESVLMLRAEISAPGRLDEDDENEASGVVKLFDRWARIGVRRSSSSRRGSAREVSCKKCEP